MLWHAPQRVDVIAVHLNGVSVALVHVHYCIALWELWLGFQHMCLCTVMMHWFYVASPVYLTMSWWLC